MSISIGLDTKCDIAIAGETASARRAIAKLPNRLLAEHVGVDRAIFDKEFARNGSLIGSIDARNTGDRRLMDFPSAKSRRNRSCRSAGCSTRRAPSI